MTSDRKTRIDLAWRRRNTVALATLCALAGALLVLALLRTHAPAGERLAVRPDLADAARERIDPNSASFASLLRLPGVGPTRAEAIIDYRRTHGDACFRKATDLKAVHGIGEGTVRRVTPYLPETMRPEAP